MFCSCFFTCQHSNGSTELLKCYDIKQGKYHLCSIKLTADRNTVHHQLYVGFILAYLTGKKQVYEKSKSPRSKPIISGVPQDLFFGPALRKVFVNDLQTEAQLCHADLYEDVYTPTV